jgi:hypothetical protein
MKSLLLDNTLWDLCLDASGNIAVCTEPYSRAQDVACAIKLFKGELWFNTEPGVPYFQEILGKVPPVEMFKELMVRAAKTVPGVVSAECVVESFEGRTVTGSVTFTSDDGTPGAVAI